MVTQEEDIKKMENDTKSTSDHQQTTANPIEIKTFEKITQTVLSVCNKWMFFDTNIKVTIYLGALILISWLTDYHPFPRTYFARKENLFNQYFVKLGWAWTLFLTVPYTLMTSYIQCNGALKKVFINHFSRILVATAFWYGLTKSFNYLQTKFGQCSDLSYLTKSTCRDEDEIWTGFDISGHAFILIYSSLVLIEEARPICGWGDLCQNLQPDTDDESRKSEDLEEYTTKGLYRWYKIFTPIVQVNFVLMTMLQLLWDIMVLCTMLYFHNMGEKLMGGAIAIFTWYFTYRFWYSSFDLPPDVPGKCTRGDDHQDENDVENIDERENVNEAYTVIDYATHL